MSGREDACCRTEARYAMASMEVRDAISMGPSSWPLDSTAPGGGLLRLFLGSGRHCCCRDMII